MQINDLDFFIALEVRNTILVICLLAPKRKTLARKCFFV